jgi:hypothetical protein
MGVPEVRRVWQVECTINERTKVYLEFFDGKTLFLD